MPKIAIFSFAHYDGQCLVPALTAHLGADNLKCLPVRLSEETAELASGCEVVCLFVNDIADERVVNYLADIGVKLILLRSTGFNHVDLECAAKRGLDVRRVPVYSPYAVAEMAVGLLLSLVRKIHKAYNRVREHNFNIENLQGFDIHGKTIGILGTGNIGRITAKILNGFSPGRLLGFDPYPSDEMKALGMEYVSKETLLAEERNDSDIISLHVPLMPETYHIIGKESIQTMKKGVVIINVSRGGLIDAEALEEGLRERKIGGVGMDVYENEQSFFFKDCSDQILSDQILTRLLTFPNVIITAHQAFLTTEALQTIADTTLQNLKDYEAGGVQLEEG
ncbi:hypothetical protein GUITHDRAFT_83711 [Guillardia theta CCMP2712]|uniref:D-lactate dehydrogenase n=1 Tax=Guillardia theta (strain CCMP2712) TaxID=905079 RepID=L1K3G8_GUITC|nr:hypothetical protein GUITHDRAFT_83711 [Guillardia theta CCMP2712]EKX55132.1 hypothetical protein GUITHDRAFT_83711 [Guillardia theta CCMP2712]|eukprot:XP_005842112.1 hypothetical protein GUITHDRAFT_83711 [Guillardia theta CCMP2712]